MGPRASQQSQRQSDSPGRPLQHVLLIEDSPRDAQLIQDQFREAGADCDFTVHQSLNDALQVLQSRRFDLILLDLGLSDSTGLDGLYQVRATARRVPTVVLTGSADEQLATQALHSGAQDYIVKGQHDPHQLLRAARHAIDRTETVELREAERLKSELLSVVSHEMRTPLTVIRENVSLILEGALGAVPVQQREFIASAVANCDRLRAMIDDLIDTAAIERGALTLERKPFDLLPLLDALVREHRPVFTSRQQTLSVDLPPDARIPIFGDSGRIRQAVANLLGNALKFTNANGETVLRVRVVEGEVRIEVRDNGVGIPRNALEQIFEQFVQLGREHGPGRKGAGLGLPIVRHLVERHGGSIGVESEVGRGSTFTIVLPGFAEGEELRALFRMQMGHLPDNQDALAAFVRVRAGVSSEKERELELLRRVAETLRAHLRNPYDETLFLEGQRLLVLQAAGLVKGATWFQERLVRVLPEEAPLLEWAICPTADAIDARSLANLQFDPVAKAS